MRFSTIAAALLPVAGVFAADWPVQVSADTALDLNPSSVTSDTLTFQFVAMNHIVTQSSFTASCANLNMTSLDSGLNKTGQPGTAH
ncbi:hypothetical protein BC835DRAFT_1409998 [Cytidiella melzeri]|nr:hypothetical protein BC835DRAFT_1409998 [Cytidiella melzeri]